MDLHHLTAHEILAALASGNTTRTEVVSALTKRIAEVNTRINAVLFTENRPDPTPGNFPIPIGIKTNICVAGLETTCASRILKGFRPPYDAGVIERLKASGAVILAGLNMDEFAFGSSTETSAFGPVCNPWNLAHVPGGSSGGSAAAVAAGEVVWALGSDTGGSIRQPASFCGVVGLKPTYGLVSRYGLIAFGSSLDQIGPLTKDVTDLALLLNIIAGFDYRDSTSVNTVIPDYTQYLRQDLKGLRIGVPKEYFAEGIEPDVFKAVSATIDFYRSAGAEIVNVSLPNTDYAVAVYYILATAEASSNLARFDGVEYGLRVLPEKRRKSAIVDMYEETRAAGFGAEAKRRIMLGTYVLSSGYYDAYYLRAQKVRTLIRKDFEHAFKVCDVLLSPTAPTSAFKMGDKSGNPLEMYLSDIFTIPANLAGVPAISLPCGFDSKNLPIGLQLTAPPFAEGVLLQTAYAYEQAHDWHMRRAAL